MSPRVVVCAGGGGVGKTTTSAALALALAKDGATVLIVTVDPARRLADALGIHVGASVQQVTTLDVPALYALMPDPALSSAEFLTILFDGSPKTRERVAENAVYKALSAGLAGMHEVVSLMLIARAVEERAYDWVIIDTAPSRYALDFVSYPGRLASLLEGKAVAWFATLAPKAGGQDLDDERGGGGLLAWGKKRIEGLVGKILGPPTAQAITELFGDLAEGRERFAALSRSSEALLLGDRTRFVLVTAPSGAALADTEYIARFIGEQGRRVQAVVLNRADPSVPEWLDAKHLGPGRTELAEAFVTAARKERQAIVDASDRAEERLRRDLRGASLMRIATVDAAEPAAIVSALSSRLSEALRAIGGLRTIPPPPPAP